MYDIVSGYDLVGYDPIEEEIGRRMRGGGGFLGRMRGRGGGMARGGMGPGPRQMQMQMPQQMPQMQMPQQMPGMMPRMMQQFRMPAPTMPQTAGYGWLAGSDQRRPLLGLGSITVPAGTVASLQAVVQRAIQGERIILSSPDLAALTVTDIKVGVRSQLSSIEVLPAETFAKDTTAGIIEMEPAQTGITVSVSVNNPTGADVVVSGVVIGVGAL